MIDGLLLSPRPKQIDPGEGSFVVDAGVQIHVGSASDLATHRSAKMLKNALLELFDLELRIVPTADLGRPGHITLAVAGRDQESTSDAGPQSYTLEISSGEVTITGSDEAGLFYGAQTLIQIARSAGRVWPTLTIVDRPAVLSRGIMLDIQLLAFAGHGLLSKVS